MKTIIIAFIAFLHPGFSGEALQNTRNTVSDVMPAETVGSNSSSTGFTVTFYRIADNQSYVFSMEPGFYNIDDKWELAAGFYNVTFTPFSGYSYGPTSFYANGHSTGRYGSTNTAPVTLNNIQFYEGGGNQVVISAQ